MNCSSGDFLDVVLEICSSEDLADGVILFSWVWGLVTDLWLEFGLEFDTTVTID